MADVTLCSVTKTYFPGRTAVDGVSLQVADGELFVLVGRSGSGKSTLLRLIAGLETPDQGEVRLGGERMNAVPPYRRDVAMVFQSLALYGHWRVRQHVAAGLTGWLGGASWLVTESDGWGSRIGSLLAGFWRTSAAGNRPDVLSPSEIQRRVTWAAELTGITPLLDFMPEELSGGEQQRVALARALVRRPKVFLLDEPLSSLDGPLRFQLACDLRKLQRQTGITMIYVTHDYREALMLGDRLAVLDAGRVVQVGSPVEMLDQPRSMQVAELFSHPPLYQIKGQLVAHTHSLAFAASESVQQPLINSIEQLPPSLAGRSAVLAFRPSEVEVARSPSAANSTSPVASTPATGDSLQLSGQVADVRPAGENNLLEITIDQLPGTPLLANVSRSLDFGVGEQLVVSVAPSKLFWFDSATGESFQHCSPSSGVR